MYAHVLWSTRSWILAYQDHYWSIDRSEGNQLASGPSHDRERATQIGLDQFTNFSRVEQQPSEDQKQLRESKSHLHERQKYQQTQRFKSGIVMYQSRLWWLATKSERSLTVERIDGKWKLRSWHWETRSRARTKEMTNNHSSYDLETLSANTVSLTCGTKYGPALSPFLIIN